MTKYVIEHKDFHGKDYEELYSSENFSAVLMKFNEYRENNVTCRLVSVRIHIIFDEKEYS